MWTLILERIWYFAVSLPKDTREILSYWHARPDHSSWYAHQIRRKLVSEIAVKTDFSLPFIRTLVALCPLLGLLGTVTGMVEVFDVMASTGAGNPRLMAAGVSKATIPTMAGMASAVTGLVAISLLCKQAERATLQLADQLDLYDRKPSKHAPSIFPIRQ
jgi:biopolymer transport protein ExbB